MVRSEAIPLPLETGLKWLFIRSSNKDQVAKTEPPCRNNILISVLLLYMHSVKNILFNLFILQTLVSSITDIFFCFFCLLVFCFIRQLFQVLLLPIIIIFISQSYRLCLLYIVTLQNLILPS